VQGWAAATDAQMSKHDPIDALIIAPLLAVFSTRSW
jgi:hypothetical protein